jgi:DNA-binding NarL/FixJ family response regulator
MKRGLKKMERAIRKRTGGGPLKEEGSIGVLTARQKEVLSLLAAGKSNKEIAAALYVEPSTVKAHIARMLELLNKRSRTELAVLWAETVYQAGEGHITS